MSLVIHMYHGTFQESFLASYNPLTWAEHQQLATPAYSGLRTTMAHPANNPASTSAASHIVQMRSSRHAPSPQSRTNASLISQSSSSACAERRRNSAYSAETFRTSTTLSGARPELSSASTRGSVTNSGVVVRLSLGPPAPAVLKRRP